MTKPLHHALSPLAQSLKPSATFALSQKVQQMNKQGADIIDLTIGEPDFPTPSWIGEAAIEAIRQGDTKYPPIAGTLALRTAVQGWYKTYHHLSYHLDQIVVGNGAKQVLFNAFLTTLTQGDQVVLPAPYWVSYQDMIECTGATVEKVLCSEDQHFKITPEQLEASLTPSTRWVVLNSPNNPSGAVYSDQEWRALGAVLERHPHVLILCDDIYDALRYDGAAPSTLPSVVPSLVDRTLIVNGVSKTFAMTGWRVGYGLGPTWLIQEMAKLQSQSTSGVCGIAQAAASAALKEHRWDEVMHYKKTYQERRDLLVAALEEIPYLSCQMPPQGAFYAFLKCQPLMDRFSHIHSDYDAAAWILDHAQVASVPGSVFGLSSYVRFSYAVSTPRLIEALERLKKAPFSEKAS